MYIYNSWVDSDVINGYIFICVVYLVIFQVQLIIR